MKKLILFLLLLPFAAMGQQPSCCEPGEATPTLAFANFAENEDFKSMHDRTEFKLEDPKGKMIEFKTTDKGTGTGYFLPAKGVAKMTLLVFHEWWGLNDHIKQEAERWQAKLGDDFEVIALDLYDGQVATTREEASTYMKSCKKERAEAIIKGVHKYVGKKKDIFTVGWCFGGGWSMQAAFLAKKKAKACAIYYGMPETDANRYKKLKADVIMVWPKQDKWINEEVVKGLEKNMKTIDGYLSVKAYDADHAFANPTGSRYDEADAQDANAAVLEFFRQRFRQ